MQLNTLNRVVTLFLIGGFVITVVALAFSERIASAVARQPQLTTSPSTAVVLTIVLFSASALAGMLIDATGNVTVRLLIRTVLSNNRSAAASFLCAGEFDERQRWREAFTQALQKDSRHANLAKDPEMVMALSAGIFFQTAEKEYAEWLIQHHSMYHLAANFVVVLLAGAAWCLICNWVVAGCAAIIGSYLLTTFSLDNYLYTYHLSFRNAYLAIVEAGTAGQSAPLHPAN